MMSVPLFLARSASAEALSSAPAPAPAAVEDPSNYLYVAGPSAHFAFPPDVGFDVAVSRRVRVGTQLGMSMSANGTPFSAVQVAAEAFYYPGRSGFRGFELGLREYYLARLDAKDEGGGDFFNPMALGMFGMGFHTHVTLGWMIRAPGDSISIGARTGGGLLVPTESGRSLGWSVRVLELHMGVGF